jgi:pimeloyl-ACP methyl ester carboxylesterase
VPYVGHQYYEETGAGLPLVLIHGHTLDRRMWQWVAPRLSRRFRLILPDMAGHGLSEPSGSPLADDIAALLDGLGLPRAAVCGFSMGGGAAVSFAVRYPERCSALIAVGSTLGGFRFPTWAGPGPYIKTAASLGLPAGLEAWLGDPLFAPLAAHHPDVHAAVAAIVREYPGTAWLKGIWSPPPAGPSDRERLGDVTAPSLVLVGEHDLPDFDQIADVLTGGIAGAAKQVVAGSGHMVPLEQPEAFAAAVETFLDGGDRQ